METLSFKFLDVLKEHMALDARENDIKLGTLLKHAFQYNNIETFFSCIGEADILVQDLKVKHLELLKQWLFKYTNTKSHGHVSRHLRLCIFAGDHAVRMEYMPYNSLRSMKLKRDPDKEVHALSLQELKKFELYQAKRQLWGVVRDLFLFQCYTGLSFIDLWLFELVDECMMNAKKERYNITWITCMLGRGKTNKRYWVELSPQARQILKKYQGEFPKISNQTYNKIIQKIASRDLLIKTPVTTHVGRKTFATLKHTEGFSLPAIADMLGNTEEVTRRHYIQQNKELIFKEIQELKRAG